MLYSFNPFGKLNIKMNTKWEPLIRKEQILGSKN